MEQLPQESPVCDYPGCRMVGWRRIVSGTWGRPWLVCSEHADWDGSDP